MYDRYYFYFDGPTAGTCVIPDDVGDRIKDTCIDRERYLDLGRKGSEDIEFYTIERWDGYVLHYGNPFDPVEPPTLAVFIENQGYDPSDDKSLREYLIEFGGEGESNDQEMDSTLRSIREKLYAPITAGELEYWQERDYSTEARAFHHLVHLPLDDGERCGDEQLGWVAFVEGDHPGSDSNYVIADSLAGIACLQYCLNELGAGIKINLLC